MHVPRDAVEREGGRRTADEDRVGNLSNEAAYVEFIFAPQWVGAGHRLGHGFEVCRRYRHVDVTGLEVREARGVEGLGELVEELFRGYSRGGEVVVSTDGHGAEVRHQMP